MIAWEPFRHAGEVYDLSHLHPRRVQWTQPALGQLPERVFDVQLVFGLHCFTRQTKQGEACNNALHYGDARETRIFCGRRYQLSRELPHIITSLPQRKCFHTEKGNFVTMEPVIESDAKHNYEVFFTVSRSSMRNVLNLYVQSAYIRDEVHRRVVRQYGSIRLFSILRNTLARKPIHTAYR
ncbi:hypothetical protein [Cupriavidus campinensis]